MTTPRRLRRPIPRSRNPWHKLRTQLRRHFQLIREACEAVNNLPPDVREQAHQIAAGSATPPGRLMLHKPKTEGYTAIMDGRA